MFKTLRHCKNNSHQLILMKVCQKVHGHVLKRLAKFEQNLWLGSFFTMSQSFGIVTRFVLDNTYGVRSIPITLSVEE